MPRPTRATISDVADRAGVAISSVSSALNGRPGVSEATRARIIAVANEMGFVASAGARGLSTDRVHAVGLVVHRSTEVLELDPFFATFISGLERCIDPRGYGLVLQIGADDTSALDRYRKLAASRRVDGVFLSELVHDDPRVALVKELGLPAVAINPDPGIGIPSVTEACDSGIDSAIQYLAERGHTSVAFLAGPEQYVHSGQRLRAWQAGCERHGVRPGPVVPAGFTFEDGERAATRVLDSGARPTAVLCVNDLSAMGFIAGARQRGIDVPTQLSVVGYDGVRIASLTKPSLTTVVTNPANVGFHAAQMLLDVIEGGSPDDLNLNPAVFTARESTSSPPAASP